MKRFDHWPTLLHEFIEARRLESFAWGRNDCCLFAADAVLAMTGVDLAAEYRGKYADARGAGELLGESGVEGLAAKALDGSGAAEWPRARAWRYAQRGDVVLIQLPRQGETGEGAPALGIVDLSGDTIVAPGEHVLQTVPIRAALRSWHI